MFVVLKFLLFLNEDIYLRIEQKFVLYKDFVYQPSSMLVIRSANFKDARRKVRIALSKVLKIFLSRLTILLVGEDNPYSNMLSSGRGT